MDDLVNNLRKFADDGYPELSIEAADRIEALEAEVARLRDALEWVIENDDEGNALYRIDGKFARRARAALAEIGSDK